MFAKSHRVKLLWIVDVSVEYGSKLANQYGVKFTTSLDEAFKDPEVDAVWMAASTIHHMPLIRQAAAQKKHIFCEKPIALELESITEAFKLVKENNVALLVAWNRRSDPHIGGVKKTIQQNKSQLGGPSLISLHSGDHPCPPIKYLIQSGGIYHDFLVHELDLSVWLSGKLPNSLYATGTSFFEEMIKNDILDYGVVVFTYPDGSACLMTGRRSSLHGYDQRIEIFTENGSLVKNDNIPLTTVSTLNKNVEKELGPLHDKINHSYRDRYDISYAREVEHLAEVLIDGESPLSNYEENFYVNHLADVCLRSYKEKTIFHWN